MEDPAFVDAAYVDPAYDDLGPVTPPTTGQSPRPSRTRDRLSETTSWK
jgi:hypothetical protein